MDLSMTSHSDPDEAGVFSSAAHSTGAQGSDLGEEARTLDRTPSGASYELGENALYLMKISFRHCNMITCTFRYRATYL